MSQRVTDQRTISAEERLRYEKLIKRLDTWATNMDVRFRIPFTPIRFGVDPVVGLVPGLGDVLGLALSATILWYAGRSKLPWPLVMRMLANMGVEFVIGILPVVGNLFDVYWRANIKNVDVLRGYLLPDAPVREPKPSRGLRWRQFGLLLAFLASLGLIVYVWHSDWRLIPDYRAWWERVSSAE